MKLCTVDGCEKPHKAKGMCSIHYQRSLRPEKAPEPTIAERFWSKVEKSGSCWEWTAYKGQNGYGQIGKGARSEGLVYAHRLSFELAGGIIPEGMFIDHACRNRGCVNPDHLRLATNKQNLENLSGARASSRSGVRGVYWHKKAKKWNARVQHNGKSHSVGLHSTLEEADAAATAKRLELFTHNDADRCAA